MITTIEEGLKFWHDKLGVNTIPADTRNKKHLEDWKRWQIERIPKPLQRHWEINNKFANGIDVVLGKIHHNPRLKDYYLTCIDLDNEIAIREFCNFNGKQLTFEELSKHGFLIEQHLDDITRAHVFVVTKEPLKKKVSSIPINGKWDENIPRIEVKSDGTCIVSVTPSTHKNGSKYQFVGDYQKFANDLISIDKNVIERHIDNICKKYDIEYLNGDARNYNPVSRNKQPIPKGERHNKVLSYTNSLIARLHKTTNRETIYEYLRAYNNNPKEVTEPLPELELKQMFNDSWINIVTDNQEYKLGNRTGESNKEADIINENNEPISYEDWNDTLKDKYQNLKNVSNENLRGLWDSLEFELSVFKILNIQDCTLPFAGILLGAPSSLKTVGIELFRKVANTFYTDNFSARAIVSHSTTVKKEQLEQIDMLPRMRNKFFLTPELSPLFGKKDEDLQETLSIITRVLDGHGYESDTGAHGHRGYNEDIMFTWVGASVDISRKVHKYLGTRGAKLYFFRLPLTKKSDDEYIRQMIKDDFNIKRKLVQDALFDYLQTFDKCPNGIKQNNLIKIQWDNDKDEKETNDILVKLSKLLAYLRAVVNTWDTDDSQGLDYDYGFTIKEDPSRAMTQLRNLARGHALSQGRNYITMEDVPILVKTVFSTASLERVRIFELLLEFNGRLSTSQIVESLRISNKTAKRTMAEFKAIGLVNVGEIETDHGGNPEKQITLVEKLHWFLSQDFKDLKSEWKEKPPCVTTQNYDYTRTVLLNSVLPRTEHIPVFPSAGKYDYCCYECVRANHGTPVYQTNSMNDYEAHVSRHRKGTALCYPNNADLELHGWEPQGKDWEK